MTEEIEVSDVEIVESDPQDAELEGVVSLDAEESEEIAEPEAQAAEVAESGEKDPAEQEEEKVAPGVQKRFNKMTREKYELQAKIAELEEKFAKAAPPTQLKEPSLEDFNYDQDAYKSALIEYGESRATQNQNATEPQVDSVKADKVATFAQKLDAFRVEAPDYADVVSQMPISQIGSDAILEMDNGPQVAYYLGNHLDIVDEINALGPVAAALRIADLSRKLKPAEPKISTAPDPVSSIKSGGGKVTKNEDDMTVEELDALDAQRWASRRG